MKKFLFVIVAAVLYTVLVPSMLMADGDCVPLCMPRKPCNLCHYTTIDLEK